MPLGLDTKSLIVGLLIGAVVVPMVRAKLAAKA
jgi:hypothetical protein